VQFLNLCAESEVHNWIASDLMHIFLWHELSWIDVDYFHFLFVILNIFINNEVVYKHAVWLTIVTEIFVDVVCAYGTATGKRDILFRCHQGDTLF